MGKVGIRRGRRKPRKRGSPRTGTGSTWGAFQRLVKSKPGKRDHPQIGCGDKLTFSKKNKIPTQWDEYDEKYESNRARPAWGGKKKANFTSSKQGTLQQATEVLKKRRQIIAGRGRATGKWLGRSRDQFGVTDI